MICEEMRKKAKKRIPWIPRNWVCVLGTLLTTELVFASRQAHTHGPLTSSGDVFAGSQAHSEGPLTTNGHVFAGSQAHTEGPLTSTEHVFAGPLAHTVLTFEHVFASRLIKLKAFCSFVFPSSTEVSFWIL